MADQAGERQSIAKERTCNHAPTMQAEPLDAQTFKVGAVALSPNRVLS